MHISVIFAVALAFIMGLTVMELWRGFLIPPVDVEAVSGALNESFNEYKITVNETRKGHFSTTPIALTTNGRKSGKGQKDAITPGKRAKRGQVPHKSCPYSFKVFVYPLPKTLPSVSIGSNARRDRTLHVCQKCILEQFALEYIVEDFFINTCARTLNPEAADFFYLPVLRDAEFRKEFPKRAPSLTEIALLDLLEKNDSRAFVQTFATTDIYWHRHGGADHVIVMPAPVTNLRHESSRRGFFHYNKHLLRPIFVALEYSKSFIETYPTCVQLKNILVPYPTTDPDLFNGKLFARELPRKSLIYYAGGVHGDCVQIRKAMKFLVLNSTALPNVIAPVKSNMREREHGFQAATFCPIPVGDSPSSKRMYDVMNFGCIPTVLSDDLVWAFSEEAGGWLDPSDFTLTFPQVIVQLELPALLSRFQSKPTSLGVLPVSKVRVFDILKHVHDADPSAAWYKGKHYINPLVQVLMRVPKEDIEFLQKGVAATAPHYRYYGFDRNITHIPTSTHRYPDGGAMHNLAKKLAMRKEHGVTGVADACEKERVAKRKPHRWEWRYPCDRDAGDGRPFHLKR